LRPELLESLFVLWCRTGNSKYQDIAWSIFTSLQEHRPLERGCAGIQNVMQKDAIEYVDDMPLYFLAETLKYLLITFGADDFVSLEDFVHPLLKYSPKRCLYSNLPPPPPVRMPWLLLGILVMALAILVGIAFLVRRVYGQCCQSERYSNHKNV
jgi:Glycosyl hydrolase family 47